MFQPALLRDIVKYEAREGKEADLAAFTEAINIIRRRHLDTVPQVKAANTANTANTQNTANTHICTVPLQMAMAVVKLSGSGNLSDGVSDTIQYFLDRLYISRSAHFTNPIC